MNWNVRLMDAKFLVQTAVQPPMPSKAVDYFTALKANTYGPQLVATNNSWGGGGYNEVSLMLSKEPIKRVFYSLLQQETTAQIMMQRHHIPHHTQMQNIIAVASITSTGAISSFSNYGATSVDIGYTGSSIISTIPVRKR